LPNRLYKRLTFNIANSTANFNYSYICTFGTSLNSALYLVGNMGNDLNGSTKVIASSLFFNNFFIYLSSGKIILFSRLKSYKPLVVT
jgi:hypothetical protein